MSLNVTQLMAMIPTNLQRGALACLMLATKKNRVGEFGGSRIVGF